MDRLYWVLAVIVAAVLGFGGGYFANGDCAKEVRATEATATAAATVKAEKTNTQFETKRVTRAVTRKQIKEDFDALPPPEPAPTGCPSTELSADELRVWNSGNQDRRLRVQPPAVDGKSAEGTPAVDEPVDEGRAG